LGPEKWLKLQNFADGFKEELLVNTYCAVASVSDGTVDQVFVNEGDYVYEWEPLFQLKTNEGVLKKVEMGVGGNILSLNVKPGDRVINDMTLAILKEDNLPSGCD
jgi:pyruvate/2-oxoglutarate dehydrogenase complex dihydrolipoamide acyltransferase (E2) component